MGKQERQTVQGFAQDMNWHQEQSQNLSIGPLASKDEDLGSIQEETPSSFALVWREEV